MQKCNVRQSVTDEHEFVVPVRCIKTNEDMKLWQDSEAYLEFLGFLMVMNESVRGKPCSIDCFISNTTEGVIALLNKLDVMIDETPPINQPQRFGNQAFRTWYSKLKEGSIDLLQESLPQKLYRAIPEIQAYLIDAFGNATRIDYGTGHELNFLLFLLCLYRIGAFLAEDNVAVVTKVFSRYMDLVRKLQMTYRMEPAGSHGVWSLDDYQFVPFIWGSSQLVAHPRIEPKSFLEPDVVEAYAKDYLFLSCIKFINEVKTGMFAEHSNQLWNISAVPSWSKINSGLIKMYKAEVLAKFPVIQHIMFGSLISIKPAQSPLSSKSLRSSMASPLSPASTANSSFVKPSLLNKNSASAKLRSDSEPDKKKS